MLRIRTLPGNFAGTESKMVDWNSEEDSGVEQDLNETDLPLKPTVSEPSVDIHTNGGASDGIHSDDNDSAHSGDKEDVVSCHGNGDNQKEAETESEAALTPKAAMTGESCGRPLDEETETAHVTADTDDHVIADKPCIHGNKLTKVDDLKDDKTARESPAEAEEEEDKIQELMTRKDTAVIFPEPVSDHEESGQANEGEVLEEEEDEECLEKEDLELQCPKCDETYTRDFLLREHILAQHPEIADKHACPQCGLTFALRVQLEKHLALHSPTSQVCKICKKTFANVYRLQRHMISHEESTELRKFKCPECGKAFKFKHHLKEHVRIHSGEKPFACSNCGKRFSHSGSYSSHMTSKKCWVVSLRSPRKGDAAISKGLQERPAEGLLRPLIPKAHDNGNGIDLSASMAASVYQNMYPHPLLPFDPTGGHLQAQILAQLNGTRPFLPPMHYGMGHMINPMMPSPQFGFPGFAPEKSCRGEPRSETDSSEKNLNEVDENQNAKDVEKGEKEMVKKETEGSSGELTNAEDKPEEEAEMSEEAKQIHLEAVKKVLEIVDATVCEQQKNSEDKAAFSKLIGQESGRGLSMLASAAAEKLLQMKQEREDPDSDKDSKGAPVSLRCRYCQESFSGPINLHQHERYLCKQNKDIHSSGHAHSSSSSSDMHSKTSPVSPSSISTERTEEEGEDADEAAPEKEIRRGRARSFITEPQSSFLRAHYNINPFPTKVELQSIADNIKLAKRVVQVWFQNMRARDRRRGKQLPEPCQVSPSTASVAPSRKATPPLTSSYIPVVPQVSFQPPVPGPPSVNTANYAVSGPRFNGQVVPPLVSRRPHNSPTAAAATARTSMQLEPLDLSTYPKPQAAHSSGKPYDASVSKATAAASPKPNTTDDIVLNLSTKPKPATGNKPTEDEQHSQRSAIYKYMMPPDVNTVNSRNSVSPIAAQVSASVMSPWHHSASIPPVTINNIPAHSNFSSNSSSNLRTTPERGTHPLTSTPVRPAHSPSLPPGSPNSHMMASPIATPPPSSLDSSFNSTLSNDSAVHPALKPKRARRKSWRQVGEHVEADEAQVDFEEEEEDEDDQPMRKKRRSWKHHRIEAADGLYACDQCDKMFNKQSSLARHKYEHSGQRPFPCDICGKAFKHKHHLTEHKRLHSGEKPFICKKCGKRFSHSGSFSQHMNHRYKYCKPLRLGEQGNDSENDVEEHEDSPELELSAMA